MATATTSRPSARERLIASADTLFYAHGVHVVGIDRVLEHSGVAKASLYKHFSSKDDLIREYLLRRQARSEARWERHLEAAGDDHRARLLARFAALREAVAEPGFAGCAFQRAAAEAAPGEAGRDVARAYAAAQVRRFTDLATDAGVRDPAALARQLMIAYDGARTNACPAGEQVAADAYAVAEALVDAALAAR